MRSLAVVMIVVAMTGSLADGVISTDFIQTAAPTIDGATYNVFEIRVTADELDWTDSRLEIELESGSIYQHPFGGLTKPNPDLVALAPDLAYDTYVTVPNDGDVTFFGAIRMTDTVFNVQWGDDVDTGLGTWTIGQITLSQDAAGPISGISYQFGTHPIAHAGGPYSIAPGDALLLDAGGSTDGESDITSYAWDLDFDGVYETDAAGQPLLTVSSEDLAAVGLVEGGPFDVSVKVTDRDGLFGLADTTLEIVEPLFLIGDADGNGFVDDGDLSRVLANWGTDGAREFGNFNGDDVIDDYDMSLVLANWTGPPIWQNGGGQVPEPLSLVAIALGAGWLLKRRPRG